MVSPIRVAVTGAAGQLVTNVVPPGLGGGFRSESACHSASGGSSPDHGRVDGVHMELDDCAFPTLHGVVKADSDHLEDGFKDCNFVICVERAPQGGNGAGGPDPDQRPDFHEHR